MQDTQPQQMSLDPGVGKGSPESSPVSRSHVTSWDILHGRQELQINHGDAIYTLRITRQGKLILTK